MNAVRTYTTLLLIMISSAQVKAYSESEAFTAMLNSEKPDYIIQLLRSTVLSVSQETDGGIRTASSSSSIECSGDSCVLSIRTGDLFYSPALAKLSVKRELPGTPFVELGDCITEVKFRLKANSSKLSAYNFAQPKSSCGDFDEDAFKKHEIKNQ